MDAGGGGARRRGIGLLSSQIQTSGGEGMRERVGVVGEWGDRARVRWGVGVRRSWWAGLVVWWPARPWPSGPGFFLICFVLFPLFLFILSYFILVLVKISTNT